MQETGFGGAVDLAELDAGAVAAVAEAVHDFGDAGEGCEFLHFSGGGEGAFELDQVGGGR